MNKESEYAYNQRRDRYVLKSELDSQSPFLTVEELCKKENPEIQHSKVNNSDEIISNLIKDKFFEVSKYVTLENSSKKIILKPEAARYAGYSIEYI